VEQEARESGGVTRGQNTVYVIAHDWTTVAQFLEPLIDKLDVAGAAAGDVQLLVLSADAESSAAIAAEAAKLIDGRDIGLLAATAAPRAARLLRIRPATIVVGIPSVIAELLRGASIKLGTVRQICIAWADEIAAADQTAALESVMTEVPKEASRTLVTSELSPGVAELVERYARRARRVASPESESGEPTAVEYLTTSDGTRLDTLRRTLDDLDPATALVFVRERDHEREVGDLLRSLGYTGDAAPVRAGRAAAAGTELAILFDLPASRAELREAAAGAQRAIALIQPRQLSSLRTLAAGGTLSPLSLPDAGGLARDRDARLRRELRDALTSGRFGRELIALEPLLDEFDGIEIAAAAVQLLEQARSVRAVGGPAARPAAAIGADQPPHASPAAADRHTAAGGTVRLFINVGTRDGARATDIVGTLTHQGHLSATDVGRVELRESHAIVEVAAAAAETAIDRVTGSAIRGRRVVVRRDEERPRRSAPGADRPPRDFSRGARPDREPRGRGNARGARPRRPRHEGGE
jgi:ATP-dependent RNA helicase DeaD